VKLATKKKVERSLIAMKGNEKYSGLSSRVRSGEDVDLWSICA
jgi:hypothetical protein